ncbi:MAG: RDD family protein [Pseudomonadota bacterium]
MTEPSSEIDPRPVGLLRRLGAVIYDALLLVAIWMILGLLFVLLNAATGFYSTRLNFVANLAAAWGFFYWFWTRTGQTLGMQSWNIQVRTQHGQPVGAWSATLRYLVAVAQWLFLLLGVWLAREYGNLATILVTAVVLFGLGLSAIHERRWMLHDWLSGTELVRVPGLARPRWRQPSGT